MARGKALAVLQFANVHHHGLVHLRALQEHELDDGGDPIPGHGLAGGHQGLGEDLAAVGPAVGVGIAQAGDEAIAAFGGQREQLEQVAPVPERYRAHAHRPKNRGLRRSIMAAMPSWASAVADTRARVTASSSRRVSSEVVGALRNRRLISP